MRAFVSDMSAELERLRSGLTSRFRLFAGSVDLHVDVERFRGRWREQGATRVEPRGFLRGVNRRDGPEVGNSRGEGFALIWKVEVSGSERGRKWVSVGIELELREKSTRHVLMEIIKSRDLLFEHYGTVFEGHT